MRLSESDVGVGLMNICPACYNKLSRSKNCCGFVWSRPDQIKPNIKLDFLTKESDRKRKNESYSYFSSLKTGPAQRWAFLFGKNQTDCGKLNEKSESYREAELKKVAQMTDRNQHLEARLFIAKKGGYTKHVKAYKALIDLTYAMGHTPNGADQVRSDLDKDLKKYLSKDVDNWKEVWGNL